LNSPDAEEQLADLADRLSAEAEVRTRRLRARGADPVVIASLVLSGLPAIDIVWGWIRAVRKRNGPAVGKIKIGDAEIALENVEREQIVAIARKLLA
jgi:hypothetical protein